MTITEIFNAAIADITVYIPGEGTGIKYAVEVSAMINGVEHYMMSEDFESQTEAEALCTRLDQKDLGAIALVEEGFRDMGIVQDGPDSDEPEDDQDDDYAAER